MLMKAGLAKTIGLSGWFGSVTIIGMRVVFTAAKKMLLLSSPMSWFASPDRWGGGPPGGVSEVSSVMSVRLRRKACPEVPAAS
jgi:hypothetical protein